MLEHAELLDSADGLHALGGAVVESVRGLVGATGTCFFPMVPGITAGIDATFFHEQHTPQVMRARTIEAMPQSQIDTGALSELFAPGVAVIDVNQVREPLGFTRSRTYNEYWRPCHIERQALLLLGSRDAPIGFVCISRTAGDRPFRDRERHRMQWLRDRIDRRLKALTTPDAPTSLELLTALGDAVARPCALFDATAALIWASPAARMLLARRTATFNGHVVADPSPLIEEWRDAARAALTGHGRVSRIGPLEVHRLRERNKPPQVLVLEVEDGAPATALDRLPPRLARVALDLARGYSDKQIASRLDIPFATVRTYVQRIYRRLGVNRRELIALVQRRRSF